MSALWVLFSLAWCVQFAFSPFSTQRELTRLGSWQEPQPFFRFCFCLLSCSKHAVSVLFLAVMPLHVQVREFLHLLLLLPQVTPTAAVVTVVLTLAVVVARICWA